MRVKNSFYKVVLSNIFTCVLLNDQTYPGCQRNFFQGRRERSLIPNQRSRTKKKPLIHTIPEPHFHVIKLGQNLSLFADWTLRSRELLIGQIEKPVLDSCSDKQRCVTSAREPERPNCFDGLCAPSLPSRTITAFN